MSTKTKPTAWSDVRAKRPFDEAAVAEHVARMEAEERAYRLREIREEQGVTQKELAERMAITQPTISALEAGDLDRSGLATLKSMSKPSAAVSKSPRRSVAGSSCCLRARRSRSVS